MGGLFSNSDVGNAAGAALSPMLALHLLFFFVLKLGLYHGNHV